MSESLKNILIGEGSVMLCQATSYLFDQINAGLEIEAKVNENPVNALSLVFLLLQHEHVVVEELLQFLVGEIDA